MKKKVLYGVCLTLLAGTSMSTLQSCKDDLDDMKIQVNYDQNQLRAELAATKQELINQLDLTNRTLQTLMATVDQLDSKKLDKSEFYALWNTIQDLIAQKESILQGLNRITDLEKRVGALETNFNDLARELRGEISSLQRYISRLEEINASILTRLGTIESILRTHDAAIDALIADVANLKKEYSDLAGKLKTHIEAFETYKTEVNTKFEEVYLALEQNQVIMTQLYNLINDNYDELNDRIDGEIAGINDKLATINSEFVEVWETLNNHSELISNIIVTVNKYKQELDDRMDQLQAQIAANGQEIDELWKELALQSQYYGQLVNLIADTNARIDEFWGYAQKQVSGIIVQSTYNPVFGDFSLPIGIQSNMLFNWYGQVKGGTFNFPSAAGEYAFNAQDPEVTQAEIAKAMRELGIPYYTLQNGQYLMQGGYGSIYATINPVNVDFSNTSFSLETSAGKKLPFTLTMQDASDEELTFGYSRETRAFAGNGFYRADISFDGVEDADLQAAIQATRIEISDEMKSAAKAFVKDRSVRDGLSLLKSVYNSMNSFLPAYALRYDWTSDVNGVPTDNAVLSKYEIAVATAKPLSYAFAEGSSISRKLPHVGNLHNLFAELLGDKSKYEFDFGEQTIEIGTVSVSFDNISLEGSASTEGTGFTINLGKITVEGENGSASTPDDIKVTVTDDDFQGLINAINNALSEAGSKLSTQLQESATSINSAINGQLGNIKTQFENILAEMEGKINTQIGNIIDDITGKLDNNRFMTAINKVIDIYNQLADKINNVLADPNHYLQPVFFYEGARRPHILSTSLTDPTPFKKNGGDAFTLYASSYSAEILAPAYKKFIACTHVYTKAGTEPKDKSIDRAAQVNKDNAGKCFGILDGGVKRIIVDASSMSSDYIYEITYQGVDYSGKTSTQKFYVTVKD